MGCLSKWSWLFHKIWMDASMTNKQTILTREPDLLDFNPDIDKIMKLLISVKTDDQEPMLLIKYSEGGTNSELMIARVNHHESGLFLGWMCDYQSAVIQSHVAGIDSHSPIAITVELFGALERMYQVCLLSDLQVREIVVFFLDSGKMNSTFYWYEYFTAVQPL